MLVPLSCLKEGSSISLPLGMPLLLRRVYSNGIELSQFL